MTARSVVLVSAVDFTVGVPSGTRSYVQGLARSLAEQGVRATLLSNGPGPKGIEGVRTVPVSEVRRPSSVGFLWELARWCRDHRIGTGTIVHVQRPDELVPFVLTQAGVQAICTLHGDARRGVGRRRGAFASFLEGLAERYALPRAAAVIAVDDRTRDAYRKRLPVIENLLSVVSVAVDVRLFRPQDRLESRRALGLNTEPLILFAGRLSPEKRVGDLIRILGTAGLRDANLLIVGSGSEERRLRRLAEARRVRFLGQQSPESLVQCMNAADVLALPSEFEGMPTVALEALACGCPVVGIRGTGLDTVIVSMETGLLAESIDEFPSALARALPRAASMRAACVRTASSFSWERVGRDVLNVYERVWGEAA